MNLWIISTLLVIIIFLLIWVIYLHSKNDPNKIKNEEALANPEVLKYFKNLKELEY